LGRKPAALGEEKTHKKKQNLQRKKGSIVGQAPPPHPSCPIYGSGEILSRSEKKIKKQDLYAVRRVV